MMASVCRKRCPATPGAAARRRSRLDRLLDPDLFKALGDPTRARLLSCLIKVGRECSVSEVAECCEVDFSVVARHLARLRRSGLVESRRQGRVVWYQASERLASHLRDLADAIEQWQVGEC